MEDDFKGEKVNRWHYFGGHDIVETSFLTAKM